jgi:anaerobic ribonucleoside-triphosphate reductase
MVTTAPEDDYVDDKLPELIEADRQRCEVWTRVSGYHRPVDSFNLGKQSEVAERKCFREPE